MAFRIRSIVLPPNAPQQAKFAASELQYYLSLMDGTPHDIIHEIGNDTVVLEQITDSELGEDGFTILPAGDHLHIRAGKRGILYGIYEILERLGCRFFTPECEKVPIRDDIIFELDHEIRRIPIFEYRCHNYTDLCRSPRFAVKSRLNGFHNVIPEKLGGYLSYAWHVHTFDRMVPPSVYGESHPEYYALQADGSRPRLLYRNQLCLTNPEVLEISVESVRRALHDHPEARIISLSQNDCGLNCQCEKCLAVDREEGSPSGTLLRFVNAIAERLEPEFPDVIFDTLAYQYTRPIPKVTRPRRNVCVRLCSIEACFSHPFETCNDESRHVARPDGTKAPFIYDLKQWGTVCDRIYIWDYTTCFAHYPAPHPNWRTLQPNMQAFARNGVRGVFEQANWAQGGGVDLNELRAYVIAKLLWDPDADVERHIREFTDHYYGAAGVYIREYINTLCDKVDDDNIHVGFNDNLESPLFDETMLDRYDAIYDKAEAAVKDDALALRRVRKARLSIRWVRMKRKAMLRHEHDAAEINAFFTDWNSYGLSRIDEWVSPQTTLRALVEDVWRGVEYYSHWKDEGSEIL